MKYALIVDNAVEIYPVSIPDLQKRHPNVSFPKKIDSNLSGFGVVAVTPTEPPEHDPDFSSFLEVAVEQDGDTWKEVWTLDVPDEAVAARNARIASNKETEARATRTTLLYGSDIDVVRAYEAGTPVSDELKAYRQALRDVPAQSGFPDSITWPTKP